MPLRLETVHIANFNCFFGIPGQVVGHPRTSKLSTPMPVCYYNEAHDLISFTPSWNRDIWDTADTDAPSLSGGLRQGTHLSNSLFSASEFDIDHQPSAFASRISDPFYFSADLRSEGEIKREVEDLNYEIDRILHSIIRTITYCRKPKFTTLICDPSLAKGIETFMEPPSQPLHQLLVSLFPTTTNTNMVHRDLVLQATLQDQVCRFLHRLFFRGETFAGVDPKVGEILESLYKGVRNEGDRAPFSLSCSSPRSYFLPIYSASLRCATLAISYDFGVFSSNERNVAKREGGGFDGYHANSDLNRLSQQQKKLY